jgi:hypothetical protein
MAENQNPEERHEPRATRNPPNVRWMALGALLIVAGVALGERLIVVHVVEKDEVLAKAYHSQDAKLTRGVELTGAEKSELRGSLLGNRLLLGSLGVMLLILPFVVGVAIGQRTASVRDAAIAVAVGMVASFAYEGTGALAIAIGAVAYFGLGALSGLIGKRLAARRAEA